MQAAVAALHAEAPTWDATDWPQIAALYGELERLAPSPVVTLNRAAALAFADGPHVGLAVLATLDGDGRLERYQPLHATRAELLARPATSRAPPPPTARDRPQPEPRRAARPGSAGRTVGMLTARALTPTVVPRAASALGQHERHALPAPHRGRRRELDVVFVDLPLGETMQ